MRDWDKRALAAAERENGRSPIGDVIACALVCCRQGGLAHALRSLPRYRTEVYLIWQNVSFPLHALFTEGIGCSALRTVLRQRLSLPRVVVAVICAFSGLLPHNSWLRAVRAFAICRAVLSSETRARFDAIAAVRNRGLAKMMTPGPKRFVFFLEVDSSKESLNRESSQSFLAVSATIGGRNPGQNIAVYSVSFGRNSGTQPRNVSCVLPTHFILEDRHRQARVSTRRSTPGWKAPHTAKNSAQAYPRRTLAFPSQRSPIGGALDCSPVPDPT
jgi:hypothetical protein